MADVLFVLVVIVFFALCALFVVTCDRIIGPDELAPPAESATDSPDEVSV